MKQAFAGLVLAGTLSMGASLASAATVTNCLETANTYSCDVEAGAGTQVVGKVAPGGFTNLKLSWSDGTNTSSGFSLGTTFTAGLSKQTFLVEWTDGQFAGATISAVPLPAGALLLGTGLAAFGLTRRRKTA